MSLTDQMRVLITDLDRFAPTDRVDQQVGRLANAMIRQAKQGAPSHPILRVIEEFEPAGLEPSLVQANAGSIRSVLSQVTIALDEADKGSTGT